jgi:hypothetical protein
MQSEINDVEACLRSLKQAPASKAKIRNVLSLIFRHAIRWGWLEQNANPVTLVRCSSKRLRTPSMLTTFELRALLAADVFEIQNEQQVFEAVFALKRGTGESLKTL